MEYIINEISPNILEKQQEQPSGIPQEQQSVMLETQQLGMPQARPKAPLRYTGVDYVFALIMPLLGFLFVKLIVAVALTQNNMGVGISVFTACFVIGAIVWFSRSGIRIDRSAGLCLAVVLLAGGYYTIYQNIALQLLALPFLMAAAAYFVLTLGKRRVADRAGDYIVFDMYAALLRLPFGDFGKIFAIYGDRMKKAKKSGNVLMIVVGVIITLPVSIFVGSLLQSADAAFDQLWLRLIDSLWSEDLLITIMQIIVSLPISMYLFSMIYGTVKQVGMPAVSAEDADEVSDKAKLLHLYLAVGGITPLLVLYLMFFFSQTAYFLSAFQNVLPMGWNYAEYARRGFFELCSVSVINLLFIAVLLVFTKKGAESALAKAYSGLLAGFSCALIVMSLSKMFMYMGVYGLTPLRVYTSWFMVFLLLLFGMVVTRLAKPSFELAKCCVCCAAVMFLLLCYADTDRIIAEYNVEAYRSGSIGRLDVQLLGELGSGATPSLLSVMSDEGMDDVYRFQAADILYTRILITERDMWGRKDWRSATVAGYKADKLLAKNKEAIEDYWLNRTSRGGIPRVIERQMPSD